jgi:hypothetical protein
MDDGMQIYRLDPIDPSNSEWDALSTIKESVWTRAASPDIARAVVARAMGKASAPVARFAPIQQSPWLDGALSSCVVDATKNHVPDGHVITANGRLV